MVDRQQVGCAAQQVHRAWVIAATVGARGCPSQHSCRSTGQRLSPVVRGRQFDAESKRSLQVISDQLFADAVALQPSSQLLVEGGTLCFGDALIRDVSDQGVAEAKPCSPSTSARPARMRSL